MNAKTENQETQETQKQSEVRKILKARIRDYGVDILAKRLYEEDIERAEF